jgi:dTDP-4-amino-4,6-dideoxygalactose transaminase
VDENIAKRKAISESYREQLGNIPEIKYLNDMEAVDHTYSYFPIFIDAKVYGKTRDELYEELKKNNIFGRRYFYPLISQFPSYKGLSSAKPSNLPVAENVAGQVICLPIYPNLKQEEILSVCEIIWKYNRV